MCDGALVDRGFARVRGCLDQAQPGRALALEEPGIQPEVSLGPDAVGCPFALDERERRV